MRYRFATFFGAFALLFGANELFAQVAPPLQSCAEFHQYMDPSDPAFGKCYFDAYEPWLPLGSGFNAEINLRNPQTAATVGTQINFDVIHLFSKGGTTAAAPGGAPGSLIGNVLMQVDGSPPEFDSGISTTLNPGGKQDLLLLDICYGQNLANCNNTVQLDKNPSVSAWIRVTGPNPAALRVQGLLQYQDFVPGGTILTMGQFWRDIDLSWEWQGPLIQTPVGSTATPNRFNTVAVLNASYQDQVVQFDIIDELGRTFASMTTLDLPSSNICPKVLPPWGSCGFLIVGRTGLTDDNGNPIQDPIGLFPSTTVLPVLYAGDGNFHGTLKVTTQSKSPLVVSGYTSRGLGTVGTLVLVPIPH